MRYIGWICYIAFIFGASSLLHWFWGSESAFDCDVVIFRLVAAVIAGTVSFNMMYPLEECKNGNCRIDKTN